MNRVEMRKALFICSPFFGYYRHIVNQLETRGFEVDYFNDRPSENAFVKGLIKINPRMLKPIIERYYDSIVRKTASKNYDLVFCINNKVLTKETLEALRKNHPNAKFVFYTWDSIKLYPNTKDVLAWFDRTYSFDKADCETTLNLVHLPLFYTEVYEAIGRETTYGEVSDRKYDVLSVCTAHPNRYRILSKLVPFLVSSKVKIYSYLFIEPLQFIYNKFFVSEFKKAKRREFSMAKLSEAEVLSLVKQSRAVLDIQHADQTGLTMRTIETLGAKRKLITYNRSIKEYDFYNKNNIYVLDDHNWDGIVDFLRGDGEPIDESIYQSYSIRSWVDRILEN